MVEFQTNLVIWKFWAEKEAKDFPTEKGKGFPGPGYTIASYRRRLIAALSYTLYPRGLKTAAEIGHGTGTSPSLIGNWHNEKKFRQQVRGFEKSFANYIRENLGDPVFLSELYHSVHEPFCWSDGSQIAFREVIWGRLGEKPTDLETLILMDLYNSSLMLSAGDLKAYNQFRWKSARTLDTLKPNKEMLMGMVVQLSKLLDNPTPPRGVDHHTFLGFVRMVGKYLEGEPENEGK